MKNYIGIDLGTTNSTISTFDGVDTQIWKSPEQNELTPSVIYIDKRSKYIGKRAIDNEIKKPGNTAKLFKRLIGTKTSIKFDNLDITMSPEECSAEILKVLSNIILSYPLIIYLSPLIFVLFESSTISIFSLDSVFDTIL